MTACSENNDGVLQLNKTKNANRNIITGIINKVITLLVPFFVRTLFIKQIGLEYAGLNSLFVSILQVLNLAELGFANAVVFSMYKPIANRDDDTICALLNFYKKIYSIVGKSILVIGLLLIPFLDRFINGTPPENVNIIIVYIIYLANSSVSYLLYGYKLSLLNAYQRVDKISNVGTVTSLGLNVVHIIILLVYPNYYLYIIFLPISTIINNYLIKVTVDRLFPQYKCGGEISLELRNDIWKKMSGLMIQKVCAISRNAFSSIFISVFISLSVVGIYNNYYMIISAVIGILALVPQAILGGIGNNVQTASVDDNYKIMQKLNCMYMWISTIIAVLLTCLFQPFMELWMGGDKMFGMRTVFLLVLYFHLLKIGDIRSMWVDAVGLYWEIRWRAVFEAGLNLLLVYIFIQIWGIDGMLLATIISLFLVNFIYSSSITFKYYFGYKKLLNYYITQIYHIFIMIISGLISLFLCKCFENTFNINNLWLIIIERSILCLIVSNLLLFLSLHRTVDFKLAKEWTLAKVQKRYN